jgi:hypothetical protein
MGSSKIASSKKNSWGVSIIVEQFYYGLVREKQL